MKTTKMARAGMIAAIYIVLTGLQFVLPANYLTYGPIQLRIAEGLTILPFLEPAGIYGLFIGCLLSNILLASASGFGLVDIICGSLVTLLAAYLTAKAKNIYHAAIYPIVLNGVIVSIWVSYYSGIPYITTVAGITAGEFFSILIFGNIFYIAYKKYLSIRG